MVLDVGWGWYNIMVLGGLFDLLCFVGVCGFSVCGWVCLLVGVCGCVGGFGFWVVGLFAEWLVFDGVYGWWVGWVVLFCLVVKVFVVAVVLLVGWVLFICGVVLICWFVVGNDLLHLITIVRIC